MKIEELDLIKSIFNEFEIKSISVFNSPVITKIFSKNFPNLSIKTIGKEVQKKSTDCTVLTEFNQNTLKVASKSSQKYLFVILDKSINSRIISDLITKNWTVKKIGSHGELFYILLEKRTYTPMAFPPTDNHFDRQTDRYQYHTYIAAMKYLNKSRVALDIGAHVGLYTKALSENFKQVISFEPFPITFDCLSRNTKKMHNVKLYNLALGDEEGKVDIDFNKENSGNSSVVTGNKFELRKLDSFNFTDIDLIKIDVEGYEHHVLGGAISTITSNKPVMIVEVFKNKEKNEKAIKIMESLNYKLVEAINKDYIFIPGK